MRHSAQTSAFSSSLKLSGALRSLPSNLNSIAVVHKGMRRVTAERFPYSVYFRAETRRVVVLAVFHGSRDPAIWQRRA
jgi:plasmid stabilization system protein ParE